MADLHPVAAAALAHLTVLADVYALRKPGWCWQGDDDAALGEPYNFDQAPPGFIDPSAVGVADVVGARVLCWTQYMLEHTPHTYAVLEIKDGWIWVRNPDLVRSELPVAPFKVVARIGAWRDFFKPRGKELERAAIVRALPPSDEPIGLRDGEGAYFVEDDAEDDAPEDSPPAKSEVLTGGAQAVGAADEVAGRSAGSVRS